MPGRYATALFELAQEAKTIDKTGSDLDRFQALLDGSEDLKRLVRSPVFGAAEQIGALDAIMTRARISGLAANFIKLAATNRRLFAISDMISAYRALVAQERGEVTAEVTAAEKLTAAQITKLKSALKASVGRDVQLAQKTDPSILGGLIVKVGSRMVDNSLRTKLQNLKTSMKGVG
jgi:F-type H+-transporting ATPase subunit delta